MSSPVSYQPTAVLGICGPRRVGKDTLASHLVDLDLRCERFSFASQLKADLRPFLVEHFDIDIDGCSPEQKEIVRPLLISYGCAQRAVNIHHWVDIVIRDIRLYAPPSFGGKADMIPVVTDVRFESEVERLRAEFRGAVKFVNLSRIGAPPPTGEEEKHYRAVAAMADRQMSWGCENEEEQRERAREVLEWIDVVPSQAVAR